MVVDHLCELSRLLFSPASGALWLRDRPSRLVLHGIGCRDYTIVAIDVGIHVVDTTNVLGAVPSEFEATRHSCSSDSLLAPGDRRESTPSLLPIMQLCLGTTYTL